MKNSNMYALSTFLLLLFCSLSFAQARDESSYVIIEGTISVTPAFCFSRECETTTAQLSGSFVAFLPGGGTQLFFPSSSVSTNPDIDFELPQEPDTDSNGTVRTVNFSLGEEGLRVEGLIDSRAFDGPLIEYSFLAAQENSDSFDPKGFFTARPDYRKCLSPLCGGYFVKKVNSRFTRCADGRRARECYVAELNFSGSIDNTRALLIQGKLLPKKFDEFGNLGAFEAKAAYTPATSSAARGFFLGVQNNGIVCFTSPCFSYDSYILNRRRVLEASSINFDSSGASQEQIEYARELLANGEVLPLSGYLRRVSQQVGTGKEVFVKQFFLPIKTKTKVCDEGYSFFDDACRTPFGCEFPSIELTGTGGAAMIDPITGEQIASVTKSCVDECNFPAFLDSPGQCSIFFP